MSFIYKEFRNSVIPFIVKGIKNFVIYPYGDNGIAVHELLVKCCNIQPVAIVDNNLFQINTNIISYKQFSEMETGDCIVILTVEDPNLNRDMYHQLLGLVGKKNVINMFKNGIGRPVDAIDIEGLKISAFIASDQDKDSFTVNESVGLPKIRLLVGGQCCWNTVLCLAKAIQEDEKYDFLAISSGWDSPLDNAWLEEHRIPYIKSKDYCPEDDKPDILFLFNTGDNVSPIFRMAACSKNVIVLPVAIFMGGISKSSLRSTVLGFSNIKPDYYLLDKYMYRVFRDEHIDGKIVELGNPKFDDIFYSQKKHYKYPKGWDKLKGKKTFLWAPDHGIYPNDKIIDAITIDKYAKGIFELFAQRDDIALIFRPHRDLMAELLNMGYWNENDLDLFENYCEKSSNIIYDMNASYNESYYFCDAILVDPYCGMVLSALPLDKPICLLYRDNKRATMKDEDTYFGLEESYYSACDIEEVHMFINMVVGEKDPLHERRMLACEKYISHYDGLNSQRILGFIDELLAE